MRRWHRGGNFLKFCHLRHLRHLRATFIRGWGLLTEGPHPPVTHRRLAAVNLGGAHPAAGVLNRLIVEACCPSGLDHVPGLSLTAVAGQVVEHECLCRVTVLRVTAEGLFAGQVRNALVRYARDNEPAYVPDPIRQLHGGWLDLVAKRRQGGRVTAKTVLRLGHDPALVLLVAGEGEHATGHVRPRLGL